MDESLVKVNIENMLSLGVYEQKIRSTAYWSYGIFFWRQVNGPAVSCFDGTDSPL